MIEKGHYPHYRLFNIAVSQAMEKVAQKGVEVLAVWEWRRGVKVRYRYVLLIYPRRSCGHVRSLITYVGGEELLVWGIRLMFHEWCWLQRLSSIVFSYLLPNCVDGSGRAAITLYLPCR